MDGEPLLQPYVPRWNEELVQVHYYIYFSAESKMKIIGIIPVMPTKQTFVMDRKLIGF